MRRTSASKFLPWRSRKRSLFVLCSAGIVTFACVRSTSAYPRPGTTDRASIASSGTQAAAASGYARISSDGRYCAFISVASNLVPGDTNGVADVFVRDLDSGLTERVSVASDGAQANAASTAAAISADGRFVVFSSEASNLVSGDTNQFGDVFVKDTQTGITERVSVASDGTEGNEESGANAISPDGRFVVFSSDASNLVPGDTNDNTDVFVKDRKTGEIARVSVASDGSGGNDGSFDAGMSDDGRFISFASFSSNLVPNDTNGTGDVFVHDRQTGVTELVSVPSEGDTAEEQTTYFLGPYSSEPRISRDGRFVAFVSQSTRLVPGDLNGASDVFVRDRLTKSTERVSVLNDGSESEGGNWEPSISGDGRYVAFSSTAPSLGVGTMGAYLHDQLTGVTELVSVGRNNASPNEALWRPSVNGDGRRIAFEGIASNLVPGDTNGAVDVFVRDRGPDLGIGSFSTLLRENEITVAGWATFTGQWMGAAADPADDGLAGAAASGAELTSASLTYRPESEDLIVRLNVLPIPPNRRECLDGIFCENTGAGTPGIVYGFGFDLEPFHYEVRIQRSATASPPSAALVALYRCLTVCEKISGAAGEIGGTGDEVRASISLREIGSPDCCYVPISGMRAFTAAGGADSGAAIVPFPGAMTIIDQIDFPDTTFRPVLVSVGFAPKGTPADQVVFDGETLMSRGNFWGSFAAPVMPAGSYDVWVRACLGTVCSPPVSSFPMQLLRAVSRKTHGNAGMFDVDLTNGGVECRSGGANGDYTLVFTFANSLTSVDWVSLTDGTGNITSSAVAADPHEFVVNLSGVTNAQTVTVNLTNVADALGNLGTNVPVSMPVLLGDTTNDGLVNSADIAQTKSQSGQSVSSANFREDVSTDGSINSADISLVKSNSGTGLNKTSARR